MLNAVKTREWSVYPVRLHGVERGLYLKVRADEGVIGTGRPVSIWLNKRWQPARVVESWDDSGNGGATIWLKADVRYVVR